MTSMYEMYKEREAGVTKMSEQLKLWSVKNGQTGLKNNQMELLKVQVFMILFKTQW